MDIILILMDIIKLLYMDLYKTHIYIYIYIYIWMFIKTLYIGIHILYMDFQYNIYI